MGKMTFNEWVMEKIHPTGWWCPVVQALTVTYKNYPFDKTNLGAFTYFTKDKNEQRRNNKHYILNAVAPVDRHTLISELVEDDHLVVANYSVAGDNFSMVIIDPDEERFESLIRMGKARRFEELDQIVAEADGNVVIFSGGLFK